jgi:hypothetical protein
VEERGGAQGVGPQRKVHGCRPLSPGVQQLLACALGEAAISALCDTILEVGIEATKGKLLTSVVTCLLEGIVWEVSIVAMIVLDPNAVLGSEVLEGTFCGNGFDQRVIYLRVDVLQTRLTKTVAQQ